MVDEKWRLNNARGGWSKDIAIVVNDIYSKKNETTG
jgi:hypothetical protein